MKTAVYAGTFDPPTLGHNYIIQAAANACDILHVAIGINSSKTPTFSLNVRLTMLRNMLERSVKDGLLNDFELGHFEDDYLVNFAAKIGAKTMIRGIRTSNDFMYEYMMRQVNYDLKPEIETLFIIPPRQLAEVSSSLVKGLVGPDGWETAVKRYLSPEVYDLFVQHYKK